MTDRQTDIMIKEYMLIVQRNYHRKFETFIMDSSRKTRFPLNVLDEQKGIQNYRVQLDYQLDRGEIQGINNSKMDKEKQKQLDKSKEKAKRNIAYKEQKQKSKMRWINVDQVR